MVCNMRRKDREVTREEAEGILKKCEYGILSTCGEDGVPYGVPVNYAFVDGNIYFHCAKGVGHKLENIGFNNKVCFTVVGNTQILSDKFSTKYESAMAFGRVYEINGDERAEVLMYLIKKYSGGYVPAGEKYIKETVDSAGVYKIVPDSISGKVHA